MTQTFTTQWFNVSNGDITTHNPQSLAPTDKQIAIQSAEVQWEGVDATETTTNLNSEKRTIKDPSEFPVGVSATIPSGATNPALDGELLLNSGSATADVIFDTDGDGIGDQTATLNANPNDGAQIATTTGDNSVEVRNYSPGGSVNFQQANAVVKWETETTTTTSTTDPRVTRDVLGESNGVTLSDGSTSNWYSLSGLDPDSEEFYHDIDGSGEARFRFRFDYEVQFADALTELRVYDADADAIRQVALADPSDPQLKVNAVRTSVDGTTYAVDVTDDPTEATALDWMRIQHPVHGTLYPRYYDTV